VAGVNPGNFNLAQVCNLFDFCYEGWHYVNDPASMEYLAKASETIERPYFEYNIGYTFYIIQNYCDAIDKN